MISYFSHSGVFTLQLQQQLFTSIENAWDFFSNPRNLNVLTPENLKFAITSPSIPSIYVGQIITYRIEILKGIRTNWITEITHVVNGHYFVDEQRFGPYKFWHHEHFFEKNENGVLMTDRVTYKVPFGIIGKLTNSLFVKK